tara:strand:+ start:103 stop:342 length:240 start_codon:yes stop_codon:yes gene_type:complete
MSKIINYREKIYDLKRKKINIKQVKKFSEEDSFVARLPYPLNIGVLIDIVERMGIEREAIVLPLLKKISREVEALKRNV